MIDLRGNNEIQSAITKELESFIISRPDTAMGKRSCKQRWIREFVVEFAGAKILSFFQILVCCTILRL